MMDAEMDVRSDLKKIGKEAEGESASMKKRIDNYTSLAMVRGAVLNNMTKLESLLNVFLAAYFTRDSFIGYDDFMRVVLSSDAMTFGRKVQMFREIKYCERKEFGEKYKPLPHLLGKLNEKRNVLAHGFSEHPTEPRLRKPNKTEHENIDEKFLKEFADEYSNALSLLTGVLSDLLAEVKEKKDKKKKGFAE